MTLSAQEAGIYLVFSGKGANEIVTFVAVNNDIASKISNGDVIVAVDPRYFRPAEVDNSLGDSTKAKKILVRKTEITVELMWRQMVTKDLEKVKQRVFSLSLKKVFVAGYNGMLVSAPVKRL